MFVRKGTVRKSRCSATNRRSTRRPRKSSHGSCTSPRRSLQGEASTSSYRFSPNSDILTSPDRSSSFNSFTYGTYADSSTNHVPDSTSIYIQPVSTSPIYQQSSLELAHPSPARGHATAIVVSNTVFVFS